jgi:hypothetical protein
MSTPEEIKKEELIKRHLERNKLYKCVLDAETAYEENRHKLTITRLLGEANSQDIQEGKIALENSRYNLWIAQQNLTLFKNGFRETGKEAVND